MAPEPGTPLLTRRSQPTATTTPMKQLTGRELADLYGYSSPNRRRAADQHARTLALSGRIIDQPERWWSSADLHRLVAVGAVALALGFEAAASMVSHRFTTYPWSIILAVTLSWTIRTASARCRRRLRRGRILGDGGAQSGL